MDCRNHDCKTAHCVSSRYVLSHYSKCKDNNCPVCAPVREAIRRNYEKSKQVVDINKRGSGEAAPPPASKPLSNPVKAEPKGKAEPAPKAKKAQGSATTGLHFKLSHPSATAEAKAASGAGAAGAAAVQPSVQPPAAAPRQLSLSQLDSVSSAIYSMTEEQIVDHIRHLQEGLRMKASDVKEMMMPLIDSMLNHVNGYIFSRPVDPVALEIPDYFEIIKNPMDLGTLRKRLENGVYRDWEDVAQDVRVTFDNAMKYNAKTTDVHIVAKNFKRDFDTRYKQMLAL